ncbi:hypothetical protein M3Y94_01293000 [Aphelenchoides besseyi]|nr:hypothetical protein M3Y94_01293000 [Aphelenchoides besseyi]
MDIRPHQSSISSVVYLKLNVSNTHKSASSEAIWQLLDRWLPNASWPSSSCRHTKKRNCFSLILFSIAIQLFVLCAVVTILLYDLFKYEYLVLIAAFSNAFIFFCFMLAERINRRLYKNVQSIVGIYTLSERYQLSENVRTCGIMKRVLIMSFMLNIICQVAVFIDIISTNIFVRQFAAVAFNFTILFYGIAFVTIPMSRVDPWKRKCVRLMRHFRSHFTCAFLNTVYPTRTIEQSRPVLLTLIEGDRMNFTVKEGTDVYFRTLAKQWEEPTITT